MITPRAPPTRLPNRWRWPTGSPTAMRRFRSRRPARRWPDCCIPPAMLQAFRGRGRHARRLSRRGRGDAISRRCKTVGRWRLAGRWRRPASIRRRKRPPPALPCPAPPLVAIVAAWQDRPAAVAVDCRPAGIMPAFAAVALAPALIVQADPNHRAGDYLPALSSAAGDQHRLPGLAAEERESAPAFFHALLDAADGVRQRGASAPLRDRYFAEMLMAGVREGRRAGDWHSLHGLTVADVVAWSGWDRQHYRAGGPRSWHCAGTGGCWRSTRSS